MKKFYFPIGFIFLIIVFSCDKYEKAEPLPVELSFPVPGIVEFRIQQMSTGQKPDLIVENMIMTTINQSISNLSNVNYVIRGFNENKKEYANFSYWQEQTLSQTIEPYKEEDNQQLSKSFNNIISYDNLEIDLLSCDIGSDHISHIYSGSYKGNFTVFKDTVYQAFGAHYTWIDYNGKITTYLDHGDFPWISFLGQIVNDTIAYGNIQMTDQKVTTNSQVTDSLGSLYFRFEFETETDEPYYLNLSLDKN